MNKDYSTYYYNGRNIKTERFPNYGITRVDLNANKTWYRCKFQPKLTQRVTDEEIKEFEKSDIDKSLDITLDEAATSDAYFYVRENSNVTILHDPNKNHPNKYNVLRMNVMSTIRNTLRKTPQYRDRQFRL